MFSWAASAGLSSAGRSVAERRRAASVALEAASDDEPAARSTWLIWAAVCPRAPIWAIASAASTLYGENIVLAVGSPAIRWSRSIARRLEAVTAARAAAWNGL